MPDLASRPPGVPQTPPTLASKIRDLYAVAWDLHRPGVRATAAQWERLASDARRLAGHADAEGRAHAFHGAPFGQSWRDVAQDLRAISLGASVQQSKAADHERRAGHPDISTATLYATLRVGTEELSQRAEDPEADQAELERDAMSIAEGWFELAERQRRERAPMLAERSIDRARECTAIANRAARRAAAGEGAAA